MYIYFKIVFGVVFVEFVFYKLFWMVYILGNNNVFIYLYNIYYVLYFLNSKSMNWKFMDYN